MYLILSIFILYYCNKIIEKPKIYCQSDMDHIVENIPSLHRYIYWTIFGFNPYIQFFIYTCSNMINILISKYIYILEDFYFQDGERTVIAWGTHPNPKAIVLILHTLCGTYTESANLAKRFQNQYNWLSVSYSRRGHHYKLSKPIFNTVGDQNDLKEILNEIKNRYPLLPIYAVGLSAGSSLLARYIGDHKEQSLISAAVLISPGYDFETSLKHMPKFISTTIVKKVKKLYLHNNHQLLSNHNQNILDKLYNSKNMSDWHDHQWVYHNHVSLTEYYKHHNPVHVLEDITIPCLYISALDDIAFPASLTKKFKKLVNNNKSSIIVHTKRGGHLGFFENITMNRWCFDVTCEFFIYLFNIS